MRYNKIKSMVFIFVISLTLTGCSCAGKSVYFSTGLSKEDVFKIEGSKCKLSEVMLMLTTEKNLYEKSYGSEIWDKSIDGITFEDYVKNSVKAQMANIKTLSLLAKEEKIDLTVEEQDKVSNAAKKYISMLDNKEKDYMNLTQENVEKVYSEYFLAKKVYSELTKDVNPEVSDAQAKVIKVQSLYKKTYVIDNNGKRVEYTSEERAKVKKNMDELLYQINNGGDFSSIAANNTDASKIEYQFGRDEMIKEFEDAAFSLATGEMSGIIDTKDGFYIIKSISDYLPDETQTNKDVIIKKEKDKAFMEIYSPFITSLTSEFNDNLWKTIKLSDMKDIKVDNFYEIGLTQ